MRTALSPRILRTQKLSSSALSGSISTHCGLRYHRKMSPCAHVSHISISSSLLMPSVMSTVAARQFRHRPSTALSVGIPHRQHAIFGRVPWTESDIEKPRLSSLSRLLYATSSALLAMGSGCKPRRGVHLRKFGHVSSVHAISRRVSTETVVTCGERQTSRTTTARTARNLRVCDGLRSWKMLMMACSGH